MRLSKKVVQRVGDRLGVNWDAVSIETLQYGMCIEFEHGYVDPRTNVTNNNLNKTALIALAHIVEYPDYYARLKRMEASAAKYWKGKRRPKVFLPRKKIK